MTKPTTVPATAHRRRHDPRRPERQTNYDANANATQTWGEGTDAYTDTAPRPGYLRRRENVTYESDPGNENAAGSGTGLTATTYADSGEVL